MNISHSNIQVYPNEYGKFISAFLILESENYYLLLLVGLTVK